MAVLMLCSEEGTFLELTLNMGREWCAIPMTSSVVAVYDIFKTDAGADVQTVEFLFNQFIDRRS